MYAYEMRIVLSRAIKNDRRVTMVLLQSLKCVIIAALQHMHICCFTTIHLYRNTTRDDLKLSDASAQKASAARSRDRTSSPLPILMRAVPILPPPTTVKCCIWMEGLCPRIQGNDHGVIAASFNRFIGACSINLDGFQ
jgi:hypothetical protein